MKRTTEPGNPLSRMSRRERQIMDIVYQAGPVSANEVLERLPDPPSYSAVRAILRVLESKQLLRHEIDGPRYVYRPIVPREKARRSALAGVVATFFDGSTEKTMAALLNLDGAELAADELDRLAELIARAREEGR